MSNDKKMIRRGDTFRSEYFSDTILQFNGISGHWSGEDWIVLYEPKSRKYYELTPGEVDRMMKKDNIEFVNL